MSTIVATMNYHGVNAQEIITSDGIAFACKEYGHGEPVVALHCSASNGRQWRPLADGLGERFRIVAPDGFGYGESRPWHGFRPFRLTDEAAIVRALAAQSGDPVHLIGHSYGGGVALRAALEVPERIRTLTLIEPSAFHLLRLAGEHEAGLFAEIRSVAETISQCVANGDYAAGMECFIGYWSGPGTWQKLDSSRRRAFAAKAARVALDFNALINESLGLTAYHRLAMPVLLIEGSRSPKPSRRICQLLAGTMPNATSIIIPGVGHMGVVEAFARFLPAIQRHLLGMTANSRSMLKLAVPA